MKINSVIMTSIEVVAVIGAMTGCTSLQSQMGSCDSEVRTYMEDGRWNAANRVIDHAQFKCEPYEMKDVEDWRKRERMSLKLVFAKSLTSVISEANSYYSKGDITEGDKVRQKMKNRYFGAYDETGLESGTTFSKFFRQDKGNDTGVPEELSPCLDLAWINMLSDRNIARMIIAYNGFAKRIDAIDVQGGKKSIKELDAIAEGFKKVGKWKDKIDLFMEKLADPEVRRWAPTDRSTYAQSIKKMEMVRSKVENRYKAKRWNTCVFDRKLEYKKIADFVASGNYEKAMQILQTHDLLLKPVGLPDCGDFDDLAERTKVASGELGNYMVMKLFSSDLSGVRYVRHSARRGVLSTLIVGRAIVDNKLSKRKLREAVRVAQLQARSEFVRYMNTEVSDEATRKESEDDEQSHSSFSSVTSSRAKADVSNLVLLAKGIYNDDVVVILGWREPGLGNVTVVSPKKVESEQNVEVSSSFGAYL